MARRDPDLAGERYRLVREQHKAIAATIRFKRAYTHSLWRLCVAFQTPCSRCIAASLLLLLLCTEPLHTHSGNCRRTAALRGMHSWAHTLRRRDNWCSINNINSRQMIPFGAPALLG
jgi:hypothetical protein